MSRMPGRLLMVSFALVVCVCNASLRSERGEEPSPEPPAPPLTAANAAKVRELAVIDGDVHQIVFRPDGKQVAFVGWEAPVEIRDAKTFRLLHTVGAGRKLIGFAFSTDSDVVALCENATTAEILNLRTKRTLRLEVGNDQPSLAFSPDGKLLLTGGYGNVAKLFNVATGKLVRSLDVGATKGGLTAVFSPNGKMLAVGNRNSTTRLFDVATGKPLHTLERHMTHGLRFSPDSKRLVAGYVDGSVRLWDVATGKLLREGKFRVKEVYTLDWSPRGDLLISGGGNSGFVLWDTKQMSLLKRFEAPKWVYSVRFTPDGRKVLVTGCHERGGKHKVHIGGIR